MKYYLKLVMEGDFPNSPAIETLQLTGEEYEAYYTILFKDVD